MSRRLCILGALAAVVGCGGAQLDPLPEVTEPASAATQVPGEPVVLALATGRPQIVTLVDADEEASVGRLQVTSSVPGVMAVVDDGERLPLPLVVPVVTGLHEVRAFCTDGAVETFNVTIEPDATVHLRVCARRRRP